MHYLALVSTLVLHLAIAPVHAVAANPRTPQAHAALPAAYEAQPSALMNKAMKVAIDKAPAQRYGYLSKLSWYTNLNKDISAYLRQHYILHWSSERPMSKIMVEFGDGRIIKTVKGGA